MFPFAVGGMSTELEHPPPPPPPHTHTHTTQTPRSLEEHFPHESAKFLTRRSIEFMKYNLSTNVLPPES